MPTSQLTCRFGHRAKVSLAVRTAIMALVAGPASADIRTWTWRGGTGTWTTGANWSVSGPTDAAEISYQVDGGNATNSTVTLRPPSGSSYIDVSINRLGVSSGDELIVTGDVDFSVDRDVVIDGKVTLKDLYGGAKLRLAGVGQFVGGAGQISLDRGTYGAALTFGTYGNTGSVTIGPNLLIRGDAGAIYSEFANDTLNNQGTIDSDVAGGALTLGNAARGVVNNAGTVRASAGSLVINAAKFTNTGTVAVRGGGTVTLLGGWTNPGVISVDDGGTLVLGGAFAETGRIARSGNNVVKFAGAMDKAFGTLRFDNTTGSWLLQSGTIKDATLEFVDGNQLTPTPAVLGEAWPTMDNLTIRGDWTIPAKSYARFSRALTLDGAKVTLGAGAQVPSFAGEIRGNGEIVIASGTSTAYLFYAGVGGAIVRSGVTIRGGNVTVGGFTNQGVVVVDVPGAQMTVGQLRNEGTLAVRGASYQSDGQLTNAGLLEVTNGGFISSLSAVGFEAGSHLSVSLDGLGPNIPLSGRWVSLQAEEYLDLTGGVPGQTYGIVRALDFFTGAFDHVTPGYTTTYDATGKTLLVTVVPEPAMLPVCVAAPLLLRRRIRQCDR